MNDSNNGNADIGAIDQSRLDCGQITLGELQDIARKGKLRVRAFGEEHFYGVGPPFHGNLEAAADALPSAFDTGMVRLYCDDNGLFFGPINPAFVGEIDMPSARGH